MMPGTNAGTGQPISFQCSHCRQQNRWMGFKRRGGAHAVRWLGRWRHTRPGTGGVRNSYWSFEYECGDCGHVGWSRHIEAQRGYLRAGYPLPEKGA